MKFRKLTKWNVHDIYRFPLACILYLLVKKNYKLRNLGKVKDEWYWADSKMLQWNYVISSEIKQLHK